MDTSTGTPLALGAAVGGVIGKELFSSVKASFGGSSMVGGVQAVVLGIVTIATLIYTLNKARITTRNISGSLACSIIGLLLGIMSSFLGIGGGSINLVVLGYCFNMDSKTAAGNSLYIILFSQVASLVTSVITGGVPQFQLTVLLMMIVGGIGGGIVGHKLNKRMDNRALDRLFVALPVLIVTICVFNTVLAFQ